jgi:hypothetical protein
MRRRLENHPAKTEEILPCARGQKSAGIPAGAVRSGPFQFTNPASAPMVPAVAVAIAMAVSVTVSAAVAEPKRHHGRWADEYGRRAHDGARRVNHGRRHVDYWRALIHGGGRIYRRVDHRCWCIHDRRGRCDYGWTHRCRSIHRCRTKWDADPDVQSKPTCV